MVAVRFIGFVCSIFIVLMHAAAASDIAMRVEGVRNNTGSIILSVCTENEFLTPKCAIEKTLPANMGGVIFHVRVHSGTAYSFQAHHDENDNKIIDLNWIGIPEEGIGFSHKENALTERPRFIDTSFVPEKQNHDMSIKIFYYD